MHSLSIFFPSYNDEGTVGTMVMKSLMVVEELGIKDFEIIVVDDGSPDNGGRIVQAMMAFVPSLRLIKHEKNRGYGGALRSGFESASKEFIFYTDGDCQYDVFELKKLLAVLRDDVEVVNGFKIKRHDPWYRSFLGRLYQYGVKFAFGLSVKDVDCDFRLMRRKIFDKIVLKENSGLICVELMKKITDNGFKIEEVGVSHYFRAYGSSQFFNFRRTGRVLLGLFFLWWRLVVRKEQ